MGFLVFNKCYGNKKFINIINVSFYVLLEKPCIHNLHLLFGAGSEGEEVMKLETANLEAKHTP